MSYFKNKAVYKARQRAYFYAARRNAKWRAIPGAIKRRIFRKATIARSLRRAIVKANAVAALRNAGYSYRKRFTRRGSGRAYGSKRGRR